MKSFSQALIRQTGTFVCMLLVIAPALANEGALRVSPSRLEFSTDAKSGMVSLLNEGPERFRLLVTASEWNQNAEGRDIYTKTSDIVFYPKNIILEAGGQQVIRVGTRGPSSAREKAYRLIIEETGQPNDPILKKDENSLRKIGVRSSILIFVKPRIEQFSGEISNMKLSKGVASVAILNSGSAHVTVTSVSLRGTAADGKELLNREFAGWYLLSGASGTYQTDIPRDICKGLARLDSEVTSDKYTLKKSLEVRKEMCSL